MITARPATTGDPATDAWRHMRALVLDNERRKEVCDALDLSFVRIKALRRLVGGPLTLRGLAAALSTDAPYTTLIVDDLVGRGLAGRQVHPADRRARIVELTAAGQAAAQTAERILSEPPAALRALPPADQEQLRRILRQVARDA